MTAITNLPNNLRTTTSYDCMYHDEREDDITADKLKNPKVASRMCSPNQGKSATAVAELWNEGQVAIDMLIINDRWNELGSHIPHDQIDEGSQEAYLHYTFGPTLLYKAGATGFHAGGEGMWIQRQLSEGSTLCA